jgi:hypothetical protein
MLVLGQTIAWAIATVVFRFVLHRPQGLAIGAHAGLVFTVLSVVGLGAGLVTYRRGPKSDVGLMRRTVTLTWAWFQAAGALALAGYVSSGERVCFAAGILALILMHLFGPDRLENARVPALE